ncbi:hypothetical protein ARMGADRAFT_1083018 [Armillaria gallica]|uniref:Uncharacterized protein n=1 Tax=Armillaria gallica TaxID=47427 RepID=A0A2H3DH01_ARMGA|nr:hypothetical protein ARMGADRAFT_1083018 [Armillaria gallica]
MAEMMCNYHGDTLQNVSLDIKDKTQESTMRKVLDTNIMVSSSKENKERFKMKISCDEVTKPLWLSKNNSAPERNGATNKFHKVFNDCFIKDEWKSTPSSDIVGVLTEVFNNIEEFRVDTDTHFTEGWMCLIYKKDD